MQHEPYYWQVDEDDFAELSAPEPAARRLQKILNRWIRVSDSSETKDFVTHFFSTMRKARDEGESVDLSDPKTMLRFLRRFWSSAGRAAKRAVRALASSAVIGEISSRLPGKKKKDGGEG